MADQLVGLSVGQSYIVTYKHVTDMDQNRECFLTYIATCFDFLLKSQNEMKTAKYCSIKSTSNTSVHSNKEKH